MVVFCRRTSTPRGASELNSGCDTIALLNLALLELAVDAADRFIGRRLDDIQAAQVFAAAEDLERIARFEAVVGADRNLDQLRAGLTFDSADYALDSRHYGVRLGRWVDALRIA